MCEDVEGLPSNPATEEQTAAYLAVEYGMDKQVAKEMVEKWWSKLPPGYVNDPKGVRPMSNREVGDRILDLDGEDALKRMNG